MVVTAKSWRVSGLDVSARNILHRKPRSTRQICHFRRFLFVGGVDFRCFYFETSSCRFLVLIGIGEMRSFVYIYTYLDTIMYRYVRM